MRGKGGVCRHAMLCCRVRESEGASMRGRLALAERIFAITIHPKTKEFARKQLYTFLDEVRGGL